MKMSDQQWWAERSMCCNCIHPRDLDLHCWTTKRAANTDAALLEEKIQVEREERLAVQKKPNHLKFSPEETWSLWIVQSSASSNKPDIGSLWVCFKEVATLSCFYWWQWPWRSVQSEITTGRVLLLCPVWWRRGEWDEMKEPLRKACSKMPVMERYTMSSQVGWLEVAERMV